VDVWTLKQAGTPGQVIRHSVA